MSDVKLGFRPDIEGMRAVAILLVVAAHANIPGMSAGFIGVDIFFVISGFLITGLLVREFAQTGRIGLADFYARRMRRLLPALALVLVASGVAAGVLLSPLEQPSQVDAAITVPFWISNLYFSSNHLGYFDGGVAANLFLHTWSLGVEEQFYLLWPALLLLGYGGWSFQKDRRGHGFVLVAMLWATALGLVVSIVLTHANRTANFYSLATRLWEFSLGGAAFLAAMLATGTAGSGRILEGFRRICVGRPATVSAIGLALMLASLAVIAPSSSFPGWIAGVPATGAALVLIGGTANAGSPVSRMLATGPMTWIGRRSYSWYLWHWPVLVLGRTLGLSGVRGGVLLVAVSLVAAAVTYRWLERPMRESRFWRDRPGRTLVAGGVLMVSLGAAAHAWSVGTVRWSTSGEQGQFTVARSDAPAIYQRGCDQWYYSARVMPCYFPSEARQSVILLGDSVGMQWEPALEEVFPDRFWKRAVLTKSSCPMVDRPIFYARIEREFTECGLWREGVVRFVESTRPELVVLGSSAEYELGAKDWLDGSRPILRRIANAAGRVVILAPTPILSRDPLICGARTAWRARFGITLGSCEVRANLEKPARVAAMLRQVAAEFPNVEVISLNEAVCPGGKCALKSNGTFVYRDAQHLTAGFVRTLTPEVAGKMLAVVRRPARTTSSPTASSHRPEGGE